MDEQCRDEIYTNTRRIFEMVGIKQHFSQSSSKNVDQAGRLKRRKLDLVNEISVMQEYAGEAEENDDMYLDEVDRYKKMKLPFSNNEILLQWWIKHSLVFPELSSIAKSLFGIPASSTTAERVFSATGLLLNKHRQSLSGDVVDDILMIRNFRFI